MNQDFKSELLKAFDRALRDKLVFDRSEVWSSDQILEKTRQLNSLKINPREAVGISAENSLSTLSVYASLLQSNLVAVPLPVSVPKEERKQIWKNLGVRFAFEERDLISTNSDSRLIVWPETVDWIFHSSGSTGQPKAIAQSARSMVLNAKLFSEIVDSSGLHLGSMAQTYTGGFFNAFVLPLLSGGKVLVGPTVTALKIREFLALTAERKPNILWVNPSVLSFMQKQKLSSQIFESARAMISCTAPLKKDAAVEWEAAWKTSILQSYGLVETLIVSVEKPNRNPRTEFSAGVVLGGAASIQLNSNRQLSIQNNSVTSGYARLEADEVRLELDPPSKISERFCTQDLAELDSNGCLHIQGRLSNMINVGGVKISAEQMEVLIASHPLVEEVAVVCYRDEKSQEFPAVLLVSNSKASLEEEIAELCIKHLGKFARPRIVRIVSQLPKTSNGKLDRIAAQQLL